MQQPLSGFFGLQWFEHTRGEWVWSEELGVRSTIALLPRCQAPPRRSLLPRRNGEVARRADRGLLRIVQLFRNVRAPYPPYSSRATAPTRRRDQPARILRMPARRCRRPAINCVGGGAFSRVLPHLRMGKLGLPGVPPLNRTNPVRDLHRSSSLLTPHSSLKGGCRNSP